MTIRIGVDIGGTFTDLIFYDEDSGEFKAAKVPTTPQNPEQGCINAVQKSICAADLARANYFLHGTTVGLNAILERKGAKIGFITTSGFRDTLEIGRGDRDEMYNLFWRPKTPLVPRRLRLPIRERMTADGDIYTPLNEEDVVKALDVFKREGVDSIGVMLINAYANSQHELRVAQLLRDNGFNGAISLSHEVSGEYREYERSCTTAIDAFIKARMRSYLEVLQNNLQQQGFNGQILITRSGSGAMLLEEAAARPFETLMSGPVAGAEGAAFLAKRYNLGNLVTADVGGTSFDTCLIYQGKPQLHYEGRIDGMPVQTPWVDVRTIGAGGGSIANIDQGGLLTVGPQSASSVPGPACYDKGGTEATVTDAAAYLGMFGDGQLSDQFVIRTDLAEQAIKPLAQQLKLSVIDTAKGILAIATSNMANAIREITTEQGLDPRTLSILAFGGAGPLLSTLIAQELDAKQIIIPPFAGNFSALGLLVSDITRGASRTLIRPLNQQGIDDAAAMTKELFSTLEKRDISNKGETLAEVALEMRYKGQEHSLSITIDMHDNGSINGSPHSLKNLFNATYKKTFGILMQEPVEIFAVRVTMRQQLPPLDKNKIISGDITATDKVKKIAAYSFTHHQMMDFSIQQRSSLLPDTRFYGPLIIRELTTTIFVDKGFSVINDKESGCLMITREKN